MKVHRRNKLADVFFRASKDALDNITSAFDFVHPLNVSLRYTRSVIAGALADNPDLTTADFQRMIDPNNIVHGVNYNRAFIDTAWISQEESLAWLLLNNLFAIHEGWAQRLFEDIFSGFHYTDRFIKNLEFPGLTNKFLSYYVTNGKKSVALDGAFWGVYKAKSHLDFSKLENYMLCYRYFKEARNCYMHHNFVASQKLIDAYNDYIPVATTTDLDVSEVPEIAPPVLGQPVQLRLRDVIGFSQLVRRIIIISDINLLCTTAAEKEFFDRTPSNWTCRTLSGNPSRAKGQINRYSEKAGFLKSQWTADYQNLLINHGIFSL